MMDFKEFTDYAKDHIRDYLPPEYAAADIRMDTINKTNEQYTGLTARLPDEMASPVLNMDQFYKGIESGRPLDDAMKAMAGVLQMERPELIDPVKLQDYEYVKYHMFMAGLSPSQGNEQVMADSPHRQIEDMLMTYNIYMPAADRDGGFMSARITNQMMEDYGINEEQLHLDAVASTEWILEPKIQSMMEALGGEPEAEPQMLIVTNVQGQLGASALFCDGVMNEVAEKMRGNYFVLPSSTHELIVVPDNGNYDRKDLEQMVRQANRSVVEAKDRLSDEVYHYDQKDRIFERAETYEKRMQDRSAERGSLLDKLQDKKEQVDRTAPAAGKDLHRQAGLAM